MASLPEPAAGGYSLRYGYTSLNGSMQRRSIYNYFPTDGEPGTSPELLTVPIERMAETARKIRLFSKFFSFKTHKNCLTY